MPWLPLAILLIVALTAAALALIIFPPGEGGEQAVGDINDGTGEATLEESAADTSAEAMTGSNLSPPPPVSAPPLAEAGTDPLPEPTAPGRPPRRPEEPPPSNADV